MLEELNSSDWEEAFKYAYCPNISAEYDPFTRDDVTEIYGIREGENDGDPWRVYGCLRDGRCFYLEASCDYTGWGCQESGSSCTASTREDIIRNGLTEEARRIFGLTEDNVGNIEIRSPNSNGFTNILKEKKKKKNSKSIKIVIPKRKINNPILGLDLHD